MYSNIFQFPFLSSFSHMFHSKLPCQNSILQRAPEWQTLSIFKAADYLKIHQNSMKFCQSAMLVIRNSSPGFLSVAICSHVDHVGLGGSRGHCRGDSLFPLQEVGKATRHGMLVGNVGMFRKGADAARTNKNRHSYSKYISIYKPHVNTCEMMSIYGGTQDKTTRPESLRPGFMISRAYCTIPSC